MNGYISMPNQLNINYKLAIQVIDEHVMNSKWRGSLWDHLANDLIEPLGLGDAISNVQGFCSVAAENIRARFPDSWNNKDLWESGRGEWTTRHGKEEIIQIVWKTSRDFIP